MYREAGMCLQVNIGATCGHAHGEDFSLFVVPEDETSMPLLVY